MNRKQPFHLMTDPVRAGFDAAMVSVNGLERIATASLGHLERHLNLNGQTALVIFGGPQIVRAPVQDCLGDFGMASHCVDGDQGAGKMQTLQQKRNDGVDGPLTASTCQSWVAELNEREPSMSDTTRIGLDLAKRVFQAHGVNAQEQVTVRRPLSRSQLLVWFAKQRPCLIGMEACATAHYWERELTALGQAPRQEGTGGKVRLGPISKRGDRYLRKLLVTGAMAVLNSKRALQDPWLVKLLAAKPRKVVAVALVNKMARIAWAVMMRQQDYRVAPVAVAA
jgi:Transposase IS116/IS110/IS902 family